MFVNDIMLTGLPRSGTTLVCHLLNKLPEAIALAEPMKVGRFAKLPTRRAILDAIVGFAAQQRESLLTRGMAFSKHHEGSVPDNFYEAARGADGLRHTHEVRDSIRFDKPLEPGFKLIIKHPAAFTALLPELGERFPTYAVIRNPLSLLASWNSARMAVNDGHAPAAERHDPKLKLELSTIRGRWDRQIFLLSWFFGMYRQHLPPQRVFRYEEIIKSGGASLTSIAPSAGSLKEPLSSRNRNKAYDWDTISTLAERLLTSEGHHWSFYSRNDVRSLLD